MSSRAKSRDLNSSWQRSEWLSFRPSLTLGRKDSFVFTCFSVGWDQGPTVAADIIFWTENPFLCSVIYNPCLRGFFLL